MIAIITIAILIIDLPDGNDTRALVVLFSLPACNLISFIMDGMNWIYHQYALGFSVQARLSRYCARGII